jgi:acetyl esterase/lipase
VGYNFLGSSSAATVSTKDIVYCNSQKLDYYAPRKKKFTKAPVVIYVHGGGLIGGSKTGDMPVLNFVDQMLDQGYAIASINYRLLTQAPNTTAPIDDTLCAIRFIRANATAVGIDPNRIAVYGWSSGAQLAATVGTLPENSPLNKGTNLNYSSKPNAVVALAGIYDFNWELANPTSSENNLRNQLLLPYYGAMKAPELQPYNMFTSDDPPVLFLQGLKDTAVNPVHTDRMEAKAIQVGARYQVIRIQNGTHDLSPAQGTTISPTQTQVNASIATFLNTTLKP